MRHEGPHQNGGTPLVTVLMPVYNAGRYLAPAIDSVLAQTFTRFELLIINDGSTDGSGRLAERYARKDGRVRVAHFPNGGSSAARNRGFTLAAAPLVAMMDADDISRPQRLQLQYDFMQAHPECVAVGSSVVTICPRGLPLHELQAPRQHEEIEQRLLSGHGIALTQGVCMVRKAAWEAAGGYRTRYRIGEDLEFMLRLARVGQLANLPDVLLEYRQHPRSAFARRRIEDRELLREIRRQALVERGMEAMTDLPSDMEAAAPTAQSQRLRFGWNALERGRPRLAATYAMDVLLRQPWNGAALRLAACVVRDALLRRPSGARRAMHSPGERITPLL